MIRGSHTKIWEEFSAEVIADAKALRWNQICNFKQQQEGQCGGGTVGTVGEENALRHQESPQDNSPYKFCILEHRLPHPSLSSGINLKTDETKLTGWNQEAKGIADI